MKSGLIVGKNFVSPLLVQHVFRELLLDTYPSSDDLFTLDFKSASEPIVEQIIAAGLAKMKKLDFEDSNFSNSDNNERGLAFRWGVCWGSALKDQVWLTSEVVTEEKIGYKGSKPTIDFVVNGDLNLGLEFAKDRKPWEICDKLNKIGKNGVYQRHDSYVVHFVFDGTLASVTKQVEQYPEDMHSRVYTFVKDFNALLCGTKVVRKGVVRKLSSPPSMFPVGTREFSAMSLGALRRLGRFL
jgi:hypothetical protein